MSLAARFDAGEGEIVALKGERLEAVAPKAFAPGQPIRFAVLVDGEDVSLEGRCQGSKKRDDGRFDVRVRLVNLSRPVRERLAAGLS
jgi:hypothetical protein